MSAPAVIRIIAQNVTAEAQSLAPGEGRRPEVQVEETALRTWLDHFAALSALNAEEANAKLLLTVPARRVDVRWFGGRLGSEIGGTFLPATVDEIMGQVLATSAAKDSEGVTGEPELLDQTLPQRRTGKRLAQGALLAGLLAMVAVINWWNFRPETPEGTQWIESRTEGKTILQNAAGSYASDNERLTLDPVAWRLTAINETGDETLNTVLRLGRRAGVPVLVTEAGVVLEIAPNGQLKLGTVDYRRVPADR